MRQRHGIVSACVGWVGVALVLMTVVVQAQERVDKVQIPASPDKAAARPTPAAAEKPAAVTPAPAAAATAAERADSLQRSADELRYLHGPEALYTFSYSQNEAEIIYRNILAFRGPIVERFQCALVGEYDHYAYQPDAGDDIYPDLVSLELRGMYVPTNRVTGWASVTPYTGSDATGVGCAAGVSWEAIEGTQLRGWGKGWQAWDENSLSVYHDGRFHEAGGSIYQALPARFSAYLDGAARWYELGPGAPGGAEWGGASFEGGARLACNVIEMPDVRIGQGFYDRRAWVDDGMMMRVTPFASIRRKVYHLQGDFNEVPVFARSTDVRVGAEYRQPVGQNVGFYLDAFVGMDEERDLVFGKLYGGRVGAMVVIGRRVRLWAEYDMISESPAGTGEGRTHTGAGGVNVNF